MSHYQGVGFSDSVSIPDDLFILNPSYQKMVTGRRNYGYLWSRVGYGGVLLTVFILFMIAVVMPNMINEVRLATMRTASTEARVIDQRISSGKSTTYYVTYEFTSNQQTYRREDTVNRDGYNQSSIGSYVQVTYAVDDPSTSHLGGAGLRWGSIIVVPFMIFILMVAWIIWSVQGRPTRQRVQYLQQNGQLILGQLKSSTGELVKRGWGKNRRTDYDVTIYCQFTTPSGKRIDAQATFTHNDLKKKELQVRGSVAVLYVSDVDYMVL